MSHLKNYRGATNYFTPATPDYRNNYDRIFGKKDDGTTCPDGQHEYADSEYKHGEAFQKSLVCKRCGHDLTK